MEMEKLQIYLEAVQEIRSQGSLPRKKKLKRLIQPLIDLYEKDKLIRHDFIDETNISLNDDLDLQCLAHTATSNGYRSDSWEIRFPSVMERRCKDISTTAPCIKADCKRFLPEANLPLDPKRLISIKKLHALWLPFLTEKKITSDDLLDQILVCYTIKKALNGDGKAKEMLYKAYKKRAVCKETYQRVMRMVTYRLYKGKEGEALPISYDDEFRDNAKNHFSYIIGGMTAADILNAIMEDTSIKLPLSIQKIYLTWFLEYIPAAIESYLKMIDKFHQCCIEKSGEHVKLFLQAIGSLFDTIGMPLDTTVTDKLKALNTQTFALENLDDFNAVAIFIEINMAIAPYFDTALNPYTPVSENVFVSGKRRDAKILNFCYKPVKMGKRKNLTTWLFGDRNYYQNGKLYQILADDYVHRFRKSVKTTGYDFDTDEATGSIDVEPYDMTEVLQSNDTIRKSKEELLENGISQRDVDIFFKIVIEKRKKTHLAEEYNLSRKQIYRIFSKVKLVSSHLLKPLLY
jgi:DNA-binding phage protein